MQETEQLDGPTILLQRCVAEVSHRYAHEQSGSMQAKQSSAPVALSLVCLSIGADFAWRIFHACISPGVNNAMMNPSRNHQV